MKDVLSTQNNYRSLSIKDLLLARDLYHYHLMNKANVVGTATGLYLIRDSDPEPDEKLERLDKKKKRKRPGKKYGERTLGNSNVREYSWPCVHAFVRKWVDENDFGTASGQLHPEDMVPKTLYLPDGRMVPVCVTKVEQGEAEPQAPVWQWPGGLFGGGMPIIVRTQEREHMATAGCLVTDGHTTYALTSRHVSGDAKEPVYTIARGKTTDIGRGSRHNLTSLPFTKVYPEFAGSRTYLNLDVGLVELSDVNQWTSRYVELGATGALADLNELNITTRLIDAPVVAVGAASGRLKGHIKALFYRFRSVGGYDYVSDFLIAPCKIGGAQNKSRSNSAQTRPGDSGAIWHLVTPPDDGQRKNRNAKANSDDEFEGILRPLAMEWGAQVFLEGTGQERYAFALATSLTTVCRSLNVEVVVEHNTGAMPYWGQLGHYSIGALACSVLPQGKLRTFFEDNVENISFAIGHLKPSEIKDRLKKAREEGLLIPLADVPDLLWKNHYTKVNGGRDTRWAGKGRSTGPEHPTHYADIDQPRDSDGKTLRELCLKDDANISVEVWKRFYDETGHTEERDRGLLPFRIWQFFDKMFDFASKGDADKFLCAAGLLSHYVGDACQPLHGSMYADGYADQKTTVTHHRRDTGEEYTEASHVGAGVHSTYETSMVDRYSTDLVKGIAAALKKNGNSLPAVSSGKEGAKAAIELMERSAERIPPRDLVDAYIEAGGKNVVAVQDALWTQFGDPTIETMADGARVLAKIWEGAWKEGQGSQISAAKLKPIPPNTLIGYCEDTKFVESLNLDEIGPVLRKS
jgi:hypothetical protein